MDALAMVKAEMMRKRKEMQDSGVLEQVRVAGGGLLYLVLNAN